MTAQSGDRFILRTSEIVSKGNYSSRLSGELVRQ